MANTAEIAVPSSTSSSPPSGPWVTLSMFLPLLILVVHITIVVFIVRYFIHLRRDVRSIKATLEAHVGMDENASSKQRP